MEENNTRDTNRYKEGWILSQTHRAQGWGTTEAFDTYEQALNASYVGDPNIEVTITKYRYQLEEDSSLNTGEDDD